MHDVRFYRGVSDWEVKDKEYWLAYTGMTWRNLEDGFLASSNCDLLSLIA